MFSPYYSWLCIDLDKEDDTANSSLPTSLSSLDLWTNPDKVEPFLATWGERLLAAT